MTDILSAESISKVRSKKAPLISRTRKALQVLQVSARDQNVLVSTPSGMVPKKEKVLVPSEESLKISQHNDDGVKETLPRRSKRKNLNSENQSNVASKEKQSNSKSLKTKASKASQSKKVGNSKKSKKEQCVPPQQSSLDSYVSVASKSSETPTANVSAESNVFTETKSDTVLNGEATMCVVNSTSDETDMLTSNDPNEMYWKLIAEERRKALEFTLYENARLKDELEVLEAENGQLNSLLKEAEKVIEVVKASLA